LQNFFLGATINLGFWFRKFMTEEKKRTKALLIIKVSISIAIFSLILLFSIIIAQTVIIKKLNDDIKNQPEYSSIAE
jgi:hypothetical protein